MKNFAYACAALVALTAPAMADSRAATFTAAYNHTVDEFQARGFHSGKVCGDEACILSAYNMSDRFNYLALEFRYHSGRPHTFALCFAPKSQTEGDWKCMSDASENYGFFPLYDSSVRGYLQAIINANPGR